MEGFELEINQEKARYMKLGDPQQEVNGQMTFMSYEGKEYRFDKVSEALPTWG